MSRDLVPAAALSRIFALLAFAGVAAQPLRAQSVSCIFEKQVVHGPVAGLNGTFLGQSVSTDGVHTAVGMPLAIHPVLGQQTGAVRILERTPLGWMVESTVYPSAVPSTPLRFGDHVALDGDVLAVSDTYGALGAVFVYRKTAGGWIEEAQLVPPDGVLGSGGELRNFGVAIAVSGDTILVGANRDDDFGLWCGAAYVFRHVGGAWTFEAKLHADDPLSMAQFGLSVALDGDRLLIGAPTRNLPLLVEGAGYLFERGGGVWTLAKRFELGCCAIYMSGSLGQSVALRGDRAALGTVYGFLPEFGWVVTYARVGGTWTFEAKVQDQDPGPSSWYGQSLSFATAERLVVGDPASWVGALSAGGSVQVFERVGGAWSGLGTFNASTPQAGMYFSRGLSARGDTLAVGAPGAESTGNQVGSISFLHIASEPQSYCTAKQNSAGCVPAVNWSGTPALSSASGFTVGAQDVLAQQVGILIWAQSEAALPFGGGTLCIGSPLTRTAGQSSGGALGTCTGSYAFTFTVGYLIANGLEPGSDVHAQYWSRDTGFPPPQAIGLTNAVRFSICP